MDFSVLTSDFRQQLEQQRSRLQKEREGIIAQAAQAVDANIAHINALLGGGATEAAAAPTKRPYNRKQPIATKTPRGRKPKTEALVDKAPKSKSTASKARKVKAPKAKATTSEFPALKAEYASLTPAQASVQAFKAAPKKVFTVDDVIAAIYGPIDDAQMARTRQRIGVMLGHSARRQECVKIDGETAQYRFNG
jgi:hypothetical protein